MEGNGWLEIGAGTCSKFLTSHSSCVKQLFEMGEEVCVFNGIGGFKGDGDGGRAHGCSWEAAPVWIKAQTYLAAPGETIRREKYVEGERETGRYLTLPVSLSPLPRSPLLTSGGAYCGLRVLTNLSQCKSPRQIFH